jgi:very-short-patch-repair endonuclease
MEHTTIDRRVAAFASRQHGAFTRAQAAELGASRRMVERRLDAGRWVRLHPSVYAIAGVGPDRDRALVAACLYVGRGAVASHRSAAWLWGLAGFESDAPVPEVLVLGQNGRRASGLRIHRTNRLDRADVSQIGAIPVTRIERTLLDLGAVVGEEAVEIARDDAIRRRLLSPQREGRRLAAVAGPGRSGSGVLRAIRDRELGLIVPRSVLEREVLAALRRRGVAEPVRQHRVVLPSGKPIFLDYSWPDAKVVLEVLGYRFHSGRKQWVRDVTRGNAAASIGWRVLQATKEHLSDGCRSLALDIDRALAA